MFASGRTLTRQSRNQKYNVAACRELSAVSNHPRFSCNFWENVTPPDLPKRTVVSRIDPSPFDEGGAYVAATRFKVDDFTPFIYKTNDFGKTWAKIVNGIEEEDFVRVVRADPKQRGVLFAGTETGVYFSIDDGAMWSRLQNNLPNDHTHQSNRFGAVLIVFTSIPSSRTGPIPLAPHYEVFLRDCSVAYRHSLGERN